MAEVFAGERDDGVFEQHVAVKVLRRGLDTEDLLARFARERRILARLEHPAIARLLDAGQLADGRPFLVMERVDGRPIHRHSEERALPLEARLRLLLVVADAVAFAHRNLVVHRDLKPSNVLVTASGEIKLLDFGIAKLLDSAIADGETTVRETRILTPAYAAPEQHAGEPTTTATDVWGLGALAFELLVGEPPFGRRTEREARHRAARAPAPPRPSARARELSAPGDRRSASRLAGDLDTILLKAMSADPEHRYSSVEAFATDLRRHLAGRPVLARPPSFGYRAAKFVRRHRLGVTAAVVVFASLALGGGIAAWQAREAARERSRPQPAVRYLTYSGRDSSPAASPDARSVAFRSRRDGRSRIWIANLESGEESPLTEGFDDHPRWAPDGESLLFTRSDGESRALHRVSRSGGEARRIYDAALFGDFSPDGRSLVFVREREGPAGIETEVELGTADGAPPRELARFAGRALHPPRFSPDGRTIAVTASSLGVGERAAVALVDVASGRWRTVEVGGSSPRGLGWTPPSRLVYSQPDDVLGWITGGSSKLLLRDPESGFVRNLLSSPTSIGPFDVVEPGRVAYVAGSFRVNLREIPLAGGETPPGHWLTLGASSDRQPAFSPDGREVVFSSNRGGNLDLWSTTLATGATRRLTRDPALDWDPAFTPDGDLVWSTDRSGTFELWRAESDGENARQITFDGGGAENPSPSRDGRFLVHVARTSAGQAIVRRSLDGGAPTVLVRGDAFLPELSPDDRWVAYLDLSGAQPALRVVSAEDGRPHGFVLRLPRADSGADPDAGRCRWFPDGRSLAVLDRAPDGTYVVFRHALEAGADGVRPPPVRIAEEPGHAAESFGISPTGDRLVVAFWETTSNLMLAENVPEIAPRAGAHPSNGRRSP
jgi:Tol biopolymer transport system component